MREIALASAQDLPEIALFVLVGTLSPVRRVARRCKTIGGFNHSRHSDGLTHQCKPASAGRAHGTAAVWLAPITMFITPISSSTAGP